MTHTTSVLEDLARQIAAQPGSRRRCRRSRQMDLCPPGGRVRPAGQLPDPAGRAARAACGRRRPAERRRCRPVPGRPQSRRLLCPAGPGLEAGKARTCVLCADARLQLVLGSTQTPGPLPDGVTALVCGQAEWEAPADAAALSAIAARLRPEDPLLPHLYLRLHRRTQGRFKDPRRDAKLYRRLYRPLSCHPSRRAGQPDAVFLRRLSQGPLLDAPRRLPPGGPGHRAVLAAVPPDRISQRPAHHPDLLGAVGAGDRSHSWIPLRISCQQTTCGPSFSSARFSR